MDFDYTTETITPDTTNVLTIGGTGGLELSIGTTAQRPVSPINGTLRYNTDLNVIEGFSNSTWTTTVNPGTITSLDVSGGTTGLTTTGGPITSSGTITITGTLATTNGGTGRTTIGSALQVLRVNATATGLEYATPTVGTVTSVAATQPAAGITISGSPITSSGTLVFALADDLLAIENLSTTGMATRTAANTWTTRTITGTAGNISVTNGDGVSGNPTLNLVSVGTPVTASFVKITTDAQGRTTATTPVITSDITSLVDSTYVNVTGDTMSGNLVMSSGATVTGIPTPTNGSDAANRNYVDAAVAGLSWKQAVKAATTVNGALATAYENGDVIDGVTLVTGDRILIKNQTAQTENGIYIVQASGAPVRSTDADTGAELVNASVYIDQGTTLADTGWTQITNAPITIGSSNIVWSQFTGSATYTAGTGLTLLGNQFSLTTPVTVGNGGTGLSSVPSNGALDIGNGTGFTRTTLTAGTGISVTNGAGSITLANTGVTSLTVTQPAAGITITNTGVSQTGAATATFALANDLAAVEGLATNGLATRTAANTWTTRTLTAASSKITVTNGDGVSGNPTVDLGTVTLDDLSNVTAPSPTVGQMLIWDGTAWIPYGGAGAGGGLRTWGGNIASQTGTSTYTPGVTAPTTANGTEIASQTITPLSTSSRFTIQISLSVSASTNNNVHTCAVFRGTTYIGGAIQTFASGGNSNAISVTLTDAPATVSSVTYSFRYGTSANTWYINRRVAENTYGGVNSGWEIQEY